MTLRDALQSAQSRNPIDGFLLCNLDTAASPYYFGYVATSGAWIIKQLDTTAGTFYYAAGDSDYSTNWAGRAGLTYSNPIIT